MIDQNFRKLLEINKGVIAIRRVYSLLDMITNTKGSLTVWALYAYFSDSQNSALSFWCGACSINAIGESYGKSQLAKYF